MIEVTTGMKNADRNSPLFTFFVQSQAKNLIYLISIIIQREYSENSLWIMIAQRAAARCLVSQRVDILLDCFLQKKGAICKHHKQ